MPADEPDVPADGRMQSAWVRIGDAVHDRIAPKVKAAKHEHVADLLERFERELVPHIAPFLTDILDNEQVPQPIRDLVAAIAAPEHFTQSLLIGVALGSVISPVLGAATAPFIQTLANEVWPVNPSVPLSPAEAALATLRHNPHLGNPAGEAALSGMNAGRFDAMVYNTGEALALGELLLLYRRGQISEDRLVTGLRQSRIRDEWLPEILQLQFAPPGAGEVIAGAVKGHLTDADATTKLGEAGINPANYAWLRASAGRPPGIEQMLHLRNRGEATTDDVIRAVRQSDINDDFLPFVLHLGEYHPPPRSIVPMLRHGAITEARARELLAQNGVLPADIDAFVIEAHTTPASTGKQLTQAQVLRMYQAHFIDRATATARLAALLYPGDEITLLLDYTDTARHEAAITAAANKIGAQYVAHHLTRPEVATALGELGMNGAQQTDVLAVWDIERATLVHRLTPAQVVGAYRRGEIDPLQTQQRLLDLGVQLADLAIVVADGWPPGKPEEAQAAAAAVLGL